MPTGTYGQFSAEASGRLPTGAYGTMNYRSPYQYPQSPMTPAVPRDRLPRPSTTPLRFRPVGVPLWWLRRMHHSAGDWSLRSFRVATPTRVRRKLSRNFHLSLASQFLNVNALPPSHVTNSHTPVLLFTAHTDQLPLALLFRTIGIPLQRLRQVNHSAGDWFLRSF
jgi:hypothetical protein